MVDCVGDFGKQIPIVLVVQDTGLGKGKHYAVNVPLRDGIDDDTYKNVFRPVSIQVIIQMLEAHKKKNIDHKAYHGMVSTRCCGTAIRW